MRKRIDLWRLRAACGFANQKRRALASAKPQAAAIAIFVASTVLGAPQNTRETYESHYGPLIEHNIFSRDRPVHKAPTTQHAPTAPPRTPEESLVLRGVALDSDGSIRAYVENVDTSQIIRVGLGDSIGRGKIVGMDIDAVEYQANGQETWIDTGADFTGKQVIAIPGDVSASSGSGGGSTTAPVEVINPNDPNLTIEQKMKLRRQHPELFKDK